MKIKIDNRKFLAIFFVFFIIIGGVLTLISSPRQIFGGIVRGYIDSPEDCNTFQKVGNSLREFDTRSSEYFIFHDISIHAYGGIQKLLNRSLIDDTDKFWFNAFVDQTLCFSLETSYSISFDKDLVCD